MTFATVRWVKEFDGSKRLFNDAEGMNENYSVTNLCEYCGLPVPRSIWGAAHSDVHYCCTGCRFAHAIAAESGEEGQARWTLTKLGVAIFFSMNVMVMTLALWAYDGDVTTTSQPMASSLSELFRFTCLLLSVPVLILLGRPLLEQTIDNLSQRRVTTDLLILSGVGAAFVSSTFSVWTGEGQIYFEVGCMILVFVTLGRWLEATGKLKSTEALDQLQQLLPEEVLTLNPDQTRGHIPRSSLKIGDRVIVQAGDRIPVDGRILSGQSTVDEQLMTGESWPVHRQTNDVVLGGTLALDGEIIVEVEVLPADGTLPRLVAAVREARERQGNYQRLADRISQVFVPFTFAFAAMVFVWHTSSTNLMSGMLAALSVVLIACPCALGIATPMALWAAVGVAAQRGIVFSSMDSLERLASVRAIRFDKTGTLTTGQPVVKDFYTDNETDEEQIKARVQSLSRTSKHVFSRAISQALGNVAIPLKMQTSSVAGKGVYGVVDGEFQPTALGSEHLMRELDLEVSPQIQMHIEDARRRGLPYVFIGWSGAVRGIFLFEEDLRVAATEMVQACRRRHLDMGVLTGDVQHSAQRIADQLSIPFLSSLTPSDKQAAIASVRNQIGPVALIGDGINDAPALASADVGISLGCGADVSRESATICLVSDDLGQIPWLIDLSRATVNTIRTNLIWAFSYNGLGMLVAATGWLHPAIAAILMVGSSVFVITNSLRLSSAFGIAEQHQSVMNSLAGEATSSESACSVAKDVR